MKTRTVMTSAHVVASAAIAGVCGASLLLSVAAGAVSAQEGSVASYSVPISGTESWSADMANLTILPGWPRKDGSRMAALRIDLAEGWKTYWRAPGDAGIPPVLELQDSDNLAAIDPQWPTPDVFMDNGMRSVGYNQSLTVPVVLTPSSEGQEIRLRGQMRLGVCKDVCVPVSLPLSLDLPADLNAQDDSIRAALADRPVPGQEAGVRKAQCQLAPTYEGLALTATLNMPSAGGSEFTIVETGNPLIWVAEAKTKRQGNTLTVTTEMMHVEGDPIAIDRSSLRFTVLGKDQAVDIQGCSAS
ncbi:protein-disulfide reductase DsbD domain-containing protein [Thalassobius sp. Cn5-15]|uniref:protein-disulfide reductase DsbD domain-containing protein n=1 Tax=Thalassobius sp. Cn5-15 TaxID=2917763 RepID=UPI001EF20D5E|nr:protein-disulfide reductase DsbD domain-containing protein [Thalassobius sp. Cn5-15]MCG7493418.1 hypothetical protein [Thalassobius sp. Cn5-15]